jgi:multicomponent Na+:H+ antiporter subunit F
MNIDQLPILSIGLVTTNVLLLTAFILAFIRLIKGPTLPDRIVALDLITILIVGFITTHAIRTNTSVYLDVAIAIALISFIGTIAFARYLERRNV